MIQGTDDYGNDDIVGDNEGPTAVIFTRCSGNLVFMIQM